MKSIKDYKWAFLLIVCSVYISIIVIHSLTEVTYVRSAQNPPFADMIGITSATECMQQGGDPYENIAFDPYQRHFNYPKIWLTIFDFLNWGMNATNKIALTLIGLFTLATIPLFKINTVSKLFFLSCVILSPPLLLLLERGNSDIIIYLFVLLAVFYLRKIKFRNPAIQLHICYLLIIFATMLKIYPIFLFPLLWFEKTSSANKYLILSYSIIILGSYFFYTFNDLIFIKNNTPMPTSLAYGRNILLQEMLPEKYLNTISVGLMMIVFSFAFYLSKRYAEKLNSVLMEIIRNESGKIILFLSGGLIYIGTFFLGNNYGYRLVFLLLTLPVFFCIFNQSINKLIKFALSGIYLILFCTSLDAFIGKLILTKTFQTLNAVSAWALLLILFTMIIHLIKIKKLQPKTC